MDEFGVLTERFGLKPQGKSAPMAAAKGSPASTTPNGAARDFSTSSGLNSNPSNFSDAFDAGFPVDVFFQSNSSRKKSQSELDDFFAQFQTTNNQSSNGFSIDYDSVFVGSGNSGSTSYSYGDDDIFGLKTKNDDGFRSFGSPPSQSDSVGDLLGGFGGAESKLKSSNENVAGFDDLIPGFGASSSPNDGANVKATKSTYMSPEDPFVVLESTSSSPYASTDSFADPLDELGKMTQSGGRKPEASPKVSTPLKPPPKPANKVQSPVVSSIDELEDFAMGRARNGADGSSAQNTKERSQPQSAKAGRYKEAEHASRRTPKKSVDELESFFSTGSRSSSVPRSRAKTLDPDMRQRNSSGGSAHMKKASSTTNIVDDLSSVFGDASVFGEFETYEGESEERRKARWGRHQRTQDRMARAVADMNQRDFQTQQEQEERSRIADPLDGQIKRWVAGKEGNMRALLSSLQYVLWPECGWQPVSLTDLITAASVKKVYQRATLCVHPDKVQQKGATTRQKYIAEKVFDILKEAWNKFKKEELC